MEMDSAASCTMGMYMNDFVYFFYDDKVRARFQCILSPLIQVEFIRVVEWFLGIHLLGATAMRRLWFTLTRQISSGT